MMGRQRRILGTLLSQYHDSVLVSMALELGLFRVKLLEEGIFPTGLVSEISANSTKTRCRTPLKQIRIAFPILQTEKRLGSEWQLLRLAFPSESLQGQFLANRKSTELWQTVETHFLCHLKITPMNLFAYLKWILTLLVCASLFYLKSHSRFRVNSTVIEVPIHYSNL